MIKLHNFILLFAILMLTACSTVGSEFCQSSGHQKKSEGYKQCTLRYKANKDLYNYCQHKQGIISEGAQLNQCLADARSLKASLRQDKGFCQAEANTKYSSVFAKPKEEKQPTLTDNGDLIVGNIVLNVPYSLADKNAITAPFVNSCMSAHGWYNHSMWQDGKRNVGAQEITAGISRLNQQPTQVNAPEHVSTGLFQAAAEGNLYMVNEMVNTRKVNVNTTNHQGYTAIHVAARRGNFQIIQTLLEQLSANPDALSHRGESTVALASYGKHHAIVNYLTEFKLKQERQRMERESGMIKISNPDGTSSYYVNGNKSAPATISIQQKDQAEEVVKELIERWR